MVDVAKITALAFNAVSGAITDATHAATLTHSGGTASGRVVVDKVKPSTEFTKFSPSQSAQAIMMEGFSVAPSDGDTLTFAGADYLVIRRQDILASGTTFYVQAIPTLELLGASIVIEAKTRVSNGSGGFTDTWASIGTPDAYFAAESGREAYSADHMQSANKYRCIVPYRANGDGAPFYSSKHRVTYQGRVYGIDAVVDMSGRGVWLDMMLTEGGAT